MFIAIVFDSRTAFYVTLSMSLFLIGSRGNDYFIGITMLFTGSIAAYTVRDIEDRMQIFFAVIFIFVGFVLSIFITGLERGLPFSLILPQLLLGLINAITAPLLTYSLVVLFNRFKTGMINNLLLKEFLSKEHPLVTQMKETAVGTFEHSREVSRLAALIAKEINANALLTRVGAMFHDIGKMFYPENFTENQDLFPNLPKDKLTPQESAKKIITHVQLGIEEAKRQNLPPTIIDFIPQHHGTFIVKHFYNVALNESLESANVVNENDFRYPGPIPQYKETAILMISDLAEALSKSATN